MSRGLDTEYRDIIGSLGGDIAGRRLARRCIDCSGCIYHNAIIDTLYVPKLWDACELGMLKKAAETMHRILCKVARRYVEDPAYRLLFDFDPALERLICLRTGYLQAIPMARVDLFFDEETLDYRFCEFNTDGSSAMNEDRELGDALGLTPSYQEMARRHRMAPFSLFDSWVREFAHVYNAFEGSVPNPHVAIVDFLELSTPAEIEIFRRRFVKAGYDCRVIDARALRSSEGALVDHDGWKVDAIYRRAVTSDCIRHLSEIEPLIRAVEQGIVCLIGGFITQVAHCKQVFEVLLMPETSEFLTGEERAFVTRHIPFTVKLENAGDLARYIDSKDGWIIKPRNSYGADRIFAGRTMSTDAWSLTLAEHRDEGYVLQEFVTPYATPNLQQRRIPGEPVNLQWELYNNLTGLYLFNGAFAGTYSRASRQPLIADAYGGATLLSVAVDPDEDCPALREGDVL